MRGPSWLGFGCAVGVAVFGCGGHSVRGGAAPDWGTAVAGAAGQTGSARVPEDHRPQGYACPTERASLQPPPPCRPGQEALCQCATDADCTEGSNGRCFEERFGPRCSYDDCFADGDCGERIACECRASPVEANRCQSQGNCAVDADCGPGGYCSPSVLNAFSCTCPHPALCHPPDGHAACGDSCGHGYFCHTATDSCIDSADCAVGQCGYDTVEGRFMCHPCLPVP